MMMACAPCWSWPGYLIAAGLLSLPGQRAWGRQGRRGMWRSHNSAPWVYVLKGGLEILGDHSCLSKQELSCPGHKVLLSWVYQVFSGCSRVCWYSVYYREHQLIWGCLYPSPAFPIPVFLTQRIQFLNTFMCPSVPLPTQQKSLLEDGHPSSSGTHCRVLRTCRALSSPGQLLPWEGLYALSWSHFSR